MTPVEVLWNGDGVPPGKGHGTSGSIMGWRWGTPLGVNRQTPVKTVPSRCTAYSGGKNKKDFGKSFASDEIKITCLFHIFFFFEIISDFTEFLLV